jgi:ubiquinone/menaquinone biosynthesis C-methylase UbiE
MKARSYSERPAEGPRDALAGLAPVLACPACEDAGAALCVRVDSLVCGGCKARFPIYKSGKTAVPWLFKDPDAVHLEWRARFNGFLHANASEQTRLKEALQDRTASRHGRERIAALVEAREAHRKQVFELLAPLSLSARRTEPSLDRSGALHSKLPKQQGLTSYYSNIFRDWSWNNGENDKLLECVSAVLQLASFAPGRLLTLGAGAGRLSYDLHRHYRPEASVALDINPLLVFLASRVISGARVALHEFPIAPLNKASFAVLRECAAPEPLTSELAAGSFSFVLADALNPPFKPGSFDTVVTPWLLDIVPQSPAEGVRAVNRQLKVGGVWINTGSLAFFHRNEAWCLSEEELLELVAASGFTILASERRRIPYLQSPASAHGRVETVLSFCARKTGEATGAKAAQQHLPSWFLDGHRSIPDFDEFVVASADHLLKAQTLAAVDGRRTVEEIALLVAKRYGLQKSEAKGAVQRILLDLYESSVARKTDVGHELE